jgi:hypothetical protein
MQYTTEVLDRATGELVEVNKGDWITVTELGQAYGVSPRRVRAVLHHMGLLQAEGRHGRYRLATFAVERGYGKRIERSKKSRWPFDVVSPRGQELVATAWADTIADMDVEISNHAGRQSAGRRLQAYRLSRTKLGLSTMQPQQEVCWLCDHFPDLTNRDMAVLLDVSEQLVGRYVNTHNQQRREARRKLDEPLEGGADWTELLAMFRQANEKQLGDCPKRAA